MSLHTLSSLTPQSRRFAGYLAVCLALFWQPLWQLLRVSLSHDTYSHILLIPFITAGLILMRTQPLDVQTRSTGPAAALIVASALMVFLGLRLEPRLAPGVPLAISILSLVALVWAGVLLVYGTRVFRSLLFPLLLLLLAVPLPQFVINRLIYWLQSGSAEVTYLLFRATGTPVLRQGFAFSVPQFTIEIAKECSGIRSAVALLITCLLAGYLFLRSGWSRIALLAAAVPVLVIKNGVRIVTLTLLSIYVDPGFLSGNLHHEGGFLFFLIGLLILWPVLWRLQSIEAKQRRRGEGPQGDDTGGSRISPAPILRNS